MRRIGLFLFAVLSLLLGLRPAAAASFEWGGTVTGRVGYGTNPFLNNDSNRGAPLVGVTIAPTLAWKNPTNTTELSGSYNRDQYLSRYSHTDDISVDLRRTQTLSSKLSVNAHVGYLSSISGLLSPYYGNVVTTPNSVDQLAVGTCQERIVGDAGLNWQPTARDSFHLNTVAQRSIYSSFGGDYSYVGVTGGYSRVIDAKTRVGLDVTEAKTFSQDFPDSSSLQPNVTVQRTLSARWTFNGGIGVIIERERFAGRSNTNVSLGFNGALCGTYTRVSGCLNASRSSAASGLGGLRRQTQFGGSGTYKLSERSRISATANYGISTSDVTVLIDGVRYGDQRYAFARLDYQRDLSRRLSAGAGASYQSRFGGGLPNVHALAITFNLTARFGRLT